MVFRPMFFHCYFGEIPVEIHQNFTEISVTFSQGNYYIVASFQDLKNMYTKIWTMPLLNLQVMNSNAMADIRAKFDGQMNEW